MKILRWLQRKSNWVCHIKCKDQFRGHCYKKPPVNIVAVKIGRKTVPKCKDISN